MSADKVCPKCHRPKNDRWHERIGLEVACNYFEPSAPIPAQEQGGPYKVVKLVGEWGVEGPDGLGEIFEITDPQFRAERIAYWFNKIHAAQATRVKELEERWMKLREWLDQDGEEMESVNRILRKMEELEATP